MADFAAIFKRLRKEKHYSQYDMASLLGVSRSIITMYETGNRVPSFDMLQKIADTFGVTTDYLVGKSEEEGSRLTDLEQQLVEKLSALPPEKQQEALSYIQYLLAK